MGERTRAWRRAQRDRYIWRRVRYFYWGVYDNSNYGRTQTYTKAKGILKQSCDQCKEWKLMCMLGVDVLCVKKQITPGHYAKWNGTRKQCDCSWCSRDYGRAKDRIRKKIANQEIRDAM